MSTLCRAKNGDGRGTPKAFGGGMGTKDSFRLIPLPFFCLPERVNGLEKISDNRKYFGNISEKQPFLEKISDLFFLGREEVGSRRHEWKKSNRCGGSSWRSNRIQIL